MRNIKISRKQKKQMKKEDAVFWEVKHIKNIRYEYHPDRLHIHFLKGAKS